VIFLALITLVLWLIGRAELALKLAKGYLLLWVVVGVVSLIVKLIHRLFGMSIYDRSAAYIASGILASSVLVMGWSAFTGIAVHSFVEGTSVSASVMLWVVGALSSFVGWFVVIADYGGHLYKIVSLPIALASFALFAVWPGPGRAMYGWFFALF
jgi:hypothetical protein